MLQRAVRTPADAILRAVRDDRHFGAIDEDPVPERPSTEPRYTRLSPEKRLRLAVLEEAFGTFRRCSGIEGPRAGRLLEEVVTALLFTVGKRGSHPTPRTGHSP